MTTGDFLVSRLHAWGIRRLYGYPGDGINGLFGALGRAEGKEEEIAFVQARHEEEAAFMACAHAKFTGEVGALVVTSGPGLLHALNGLYDAKKDHVPLVALVGQQARVGLGGQYMQEIDAKGLLGHVCTFVEQASVPAQVRHLLDTAVRVAIAERTVTALVLPNDLLEEAFEDPPRTHGATFSGVGYHAPRRLPHDPALDAAAALLNAAERVAVLVGKGAEGATEETRALVDALGAGYAKSVLALWMLPDEPACTGPIGLIGTPASHRLMQEADALVLLGTSFPYAEHLPEEGKVKAVQIDTDASRLALRYPVDVPLDGDAKETLRALLPRLTRKADRSWQDKVIKWAEDDRAADARMAEAEADGLNPMRLFRALDERLPEGAIVVSDVGSGTAWWARLLRPRAGMAGSTSGGLASMGNAVPYANAAKFALPGRPVVAVVGDGAMQMLGLAALITTAKYAPEWTNRQLVVVVLNNRDLNMVTWEQRAMMGDPKFEASQSIPDVAYDAFAESLGLLGLRVDRTEDLPDVLDRAFAADRPVVVNAYVDGNVPILPPHVTFEMAKNMMLSLPKEGAAGLGVAVQSAKAVASAVAEKIGL